MIDRTDDETGELVREFLERYGLWIGAAIVILVFGIWGYQHWQHQKLEAARAQSALLDTLEQAVNNQQPATAEKILPQLTAGSNLHALGALLLARAYYPAQPQKVQNYLATAEKAQDPLIAATARWQEAKLALAAGKLKRTQSLLQSLKGSFYTPQLPILEGIVAQRNGQLEKAAQDYREAGNRSAAPEFWNQQAELATLLRQVGAK